MSLSVYASKLTPHLQKFSRCGGCMGASCNAKGTSKHRIATTYEEASASYWRRSFVLVPHAEMRFTHRHQNLLDHLDASKSGQTHDNGFCFIGRRVLHLVLKYFVYETFMCNISQEKRCRCSIMAITILNLKKNSITERTRFPTKHYKNFHHI